MEYCESYVNVPEKTLVLYNSFFRLTVFAGRQVSFGWQGIFYTLNVLQFSFDS